MAAKKPGVAPPTKTTAGPNVPTSTVGPGIPPGGVPAGTTSVVS